ncbi:VIT family-domain-containing protein [Zopfochytrium polystomum]|nr:VIT family-domain-containing protein [Zopfochytrium polystomum]
MPVPQPSAAPPAPAAPGVGVAAPTPHQLQQQQHQKQQDASVAVAPPRIRLADDDQDQDPNSRAPRRSLYLNVHHHQHQHNCSDTSGCAPCTCARCEAARTPPPRSPPFSSSSSSSSSSSNGAAAATNEDGQAAAAAAFQLSTHTSSPSGFLTASADVDDDDNVPASASRGTPTPTPTSQQQLLVATAEPAASAAAVVVAASDVSFTAPSVANSITPSDTGHRHYSHRAPNLRAAVLGANDGIVSIAALVLGLAAAGSDHHAVVTGGVSALLAGALSMACGEFVSVASQRDAESADVARETQELQKGPSHVRRELTQLAEHYEQLGIDCTMSRQIAKELHRSAATVDGIVKVHMREELAIDVDQLSNPWSAAGLSCAAFAVGGGVPVALAAAIRSTVPRVAAVASVAAVLLAVFGAIGAWIGGAPIAKGATRVFVGGVLAMAVTFAVGLAFGAATGG